MFTVHKKISNRFDHTDSWSVQRKLVLFSTLVILAIIPLTVLATISFRTLTSKAVVVSGPYGDCTYFGCRGPNLFQSWSSPNYQVRYECLSSCFSTGGFSAWVNNGTSRSFTAPNNFKIYRWEVQVLTRTSSGTSVQWVDYSKGDNFGSDGSISWSAPTYSAQLTHDNDISNGVPVNACYKGLGQTSNRLSGCVDAYSGTGTSTTFVGLSPNEYYDLYVFVKVYDKSNKILAIKDHIGPTGACTDCPIAPPPPPGPPTKPTSLNPGSVVLPPACAPSGSTWGGQLNFSWSGSGATTYVVDISETNTFVPGFTNKITNGSTFSLSGTGGWNNQLYSGLSVNGTLVLQPGKDYYWRVFAKNDANPPVYSDVQKVYLPSCATSKPAIPSNLNNGLSTFIACVPEGSTWGTQAVFNWYGSNATLYAVDLADNSAFYPGFANKTLNSSGAAGTYTLTGSGGWNNNVGTTYSLNGNLNLKPGVTYFWRVYAKNSAGVAEPLPVSTIYMAKCSTSQPPTKPVISGDSDLLSCLPSDKQFWGPTHAFSWIGGSGANEIWIDVSDSSNFASFANRKLSAGTTATNGSGGWNANGSSLTLNYNLNLAAGKTYYFRIFAVNNTPPGVHSDSKAFSLAVCPPAPIIPQPTPQTTTLPSPWKTADINTTLGGAIFDSDDGVYTVSGGGTDIWGTSDSFRYTWMELNGDGTFAAELSNQKNTDGWAKAGLMIRESTNPSSKFGFIAITPSNGVAFQFRDNTGANAQHRYNSAIDGNRRPIRLVITRNGTSVYGQIMDTNGSLVQIGSATISMNRRVLIGFAVTAHNSTGQSFAKFSKISGGAFATSRPTEGADLLRVQQLSCSADGKTATVKFIWNGPSDIGAQYIVDLSTRQESYTRWNTWTNNALAKEPKNGTEYIWGGVAANTVTWWRVYSAHVSDPTKRHSYAAAFVACNNRPTGSPVNGYISSYFGPSHPPDGIDIAHGGVYEKYQPVYATMSGVVAFAGNDTSSGYGNQVVIYRPVVNFNGEQVAFLVRYAHMDSIEPNIYSGRIVPWGTKLGIQGQTGNVDAAGGADAIHVHYEVRKAPANTSFATMNTTYNTSDSRATYGVDPLTNNGQDYNLQRWVCGVGGAGNECLQSPF